MTSQDKNATQQFQQASFSSPLLNAALEDMNHTHGLMCGKALGENELRLIERGHQIIDKFIDRPAGEKESLKAFMTLSLAPTFDEVETFATRYNPHVSDMMMTLMNLDKSEDTQQAIMALHTAVLEIAHEDLTTSAHTREEFFQRSGIVSTEAIQYEVDKHAESELSASAPRLLEHLKELWPQVVDALQNVPYIDMETSAPSARPLLLK